MAEFKLCCALSWKYTPKSCDTAIILVQFQCIFSCNCSLRTWLGLCLLCEILKCHNHRRSYLISFACFPHLQSYRVCQKSDTLVNYVNIMSYKLKDTRYLHCLNNFDIHYYWFIELLCSMCPPCCCTTRVRRRRHSSMLRLMKRCDNLLHYSTMVCFSWSTLDCSKFSVLLDLLLKSTRNSIINGV